MSKITIPHIPVYGSESYMSKEEKETKKQACGFCPGDKCLLDCAICVPKIKK